MDCSPSDHSKLSMRIFELLSDGYVQAFGMRFLMAFRKWSVAVMTISS
jgi:hypothetical protein